MASEQYQKYFHRTEKYRISSSSAPNMTNKIERLMDQTRQGDRVAQALLRGIVLPIGGLKEKLLAAHRAGIKKVLIPTENKKDLVEVPKTILETMEIIPVKNVDEVLKVALTKPLKRVEWVEVDQISEKNKSKEELRTQ